MQNIFSEKILDTWEIFRKVHLNPQIKKKYIYTIEYTVDWSNDPNSSFSSCSIKHPHPCLIVIRLDFSSSWLWAWTCDCCGTRWGLKCAPAVVHALCCSRLLLKVSSELRKMKNMWRQRASNPELGGKPRIPRAYWLFASHVSWFTLCILPGTPSLPTETLSIL